ncbi:MAG: leucyl/phenylalanyl-tRNA--protein transferase [Paracoccaceae bacterium]
MKDEAEITPTMLLQAYAAGIFPMADSADAEEFFWVDPKRRGIIPLDRFHLSRSLRKRVLKGGYEVRVDSAFSEVVTACANRPDTWINPGIERLYRALNRMGYAHSVEIWIDGDLAGGLYGVAIAAAFFGESMFSRRRDASKIAAVALVARLRAGGFRLLDTQFVTDHLVSLGAVEISRRAYHARLSAALARPADFFALPLDASPQELVQLVSQTS